MQNKKQKLGDLGQHWTPTQTVDLMMSLFSPKPSRLLEPTAGSGRFVRHAISLGVQDILAVEIDPRVVPEDLGHLYQSKNFFEWKGGKYEAIVGNPPYVAGRLIGDSLGSWTGMTPRTGNLYLHVIEKCIREHLLPGGQIIFIVPDTLLNGTSRGKKLRQWMLSNGAFTHILRPDVKWDKAAVETLIFRWVLGSQQGLVQTDEGLKKLVSNNDSIALIKEKTCGFFGDYFELGVGAAPRADLKTSPEDPRGKPFIKSGSLEWFQVSDEIQWPRWRLTAPRHKLLIMPGPTRNLRPIYTTLNWDVDQASRHLDIYAIPKFEVPNSKLPELASFLNDWFSDVGETLGIRKSGRWGAGPRLLASLPIDDRFLQHIKNAMSVETNS